jgi:hypothetical protein
MSVQFLSHFLKPFATLSADSLVTQPRPDRVDRDSETSRDEPNRDGRSSRMYDLLNNIDMSSGEGMCLSGVKAAQLF